MSFKSDFIANYGPLAQDIADQTGLDPTLVLGQAAHETGWGQHISGNNVFGISPGGRVAAYPSVPAAGQAYADLINHRYLDAANHDSVQGQAQALSKGGYGPTSDYGQRIAAAADSVRAAGFQPRSGPSDADVAAGQAVFEQMTGQKAPPIPGEPTQQTSVDVSSDPLVDQGKEIFKAMTGIDPGARAASTSSPTQSTSSAETSAGAGQNFLAGTMHGLYTTTQPLLSGGVNLLSQVPGVSMIDKSVPLLGRLDQTYGHPDPAMLAQQEADYQAKYGGSLMAKAGDITGQIAATLPVTGPLGGLGESLAAQTGPLLGGAIRMGANALQGGVGAAMTGGDIGTGALAGGALGAAVPIIKGVGNSLADNGILGRVFTHEMAKSLGMLAGFHLGGGIVEALVGRSVGDALKDILAKYGPQAADAAAKALAAANQSGLTTSAAGMAGGQVGNQLSGQ